MLGLGSQRVQELFAVAYGQRVARDIGGSDPERTTALKVAECVSTTTATLHASVLSQFRGRYCQGIFNGTCIKMSVLADPPTLEKEYDPSFSSRPFLLQPCSPYFEVPVAHGRRALQHGGCTPPPLRHHPRVRSAADVDFVRGFPLMLFSGFY